MRHARILLTAMVINALLGGLVSAQDGQLPPGHPPTGAPTQQVPSAAPAPVAPPQAGAIEEGQQAPQDAIHGGMAGNAPQIATAAPSAEVPVGSVRFTVVDPQGNPVPNAHIEVGILEREGEKKKATKATTDERGMHTFTGLDTGDAQAYRAKLMHDGATYGTMPFRLDETQGYDVRITQIPTTRDPRAVLQLLTRVALQLKDNRLHVVRQAQLINMSQFTYVFSEEGLKVPLPKGFTAFQTQGQMTDQRILEDGDGFVIKGSVAPGQASLIWAYDIPFSGTELSFSLDMPFQTFNYAVESDAPKGLKLRVDGMPEAQLVEGQGAKFLLTQMQRDPREPGLDTLRISLSGLPGPGPGRMLATGAAAVFLLISLGFLFFGGDARKALQQGRDMRRAEILEEVDELERQFKADEVGPKYRANQLEALTLELAGLLRDEAAAKATAKSAPNAKPKGKTSPAKRA